LVMDNQGDFHGIAQQASTPSRKYIFCYETGATMYNSVKAPARRVGLFLQDTTAASLTTAGWQLFDAAVEWALGANKANCIQSDNFNNSSLEAFWTAVDVGNPLLGAQAETATNLTITANGDDIWGTADNFRYIFQIVSGDFDVSLQVNFVPTTDAWSKVGIMMRESLAPGSKHVFICATRSNNYAFQRRLVTDDISYNTGGGTYTNNTPGYVRLVKSGNNFTGYYSGDDINWTPLGNVNINFNSTFLIGIAVTSHNAGATGFASVDNFNVLEGACTPTYTITQTRTMSPTFTATPTNTPFFAGCIQPDGFSNGVLENFWTAADIGSPAAGSQTETMTNLTITAAGVIWGTVDAFRYIYQPVAGNVDATLQINFVSEANGWAGTGIMIRETLNADSRNVYMLASTNAFSMQCRSTTAGTTFSTDGAAYVNNTTGYVRLLKSGNNFTGYYSTNGADWNVVGNYTVNVGTNFYIGVAAATNLIDTTGYFSISNFNVLSGGCTPTATKTSTETVTCTITPTWTLTDTPTQTTTITPSVTQTITSTITMSFTPTHTVTYTKQTTADCGDAITIDGMLNETAWATGIWQIISKFVTGYINGVSAAFQVRWDMNNVYVGINVTDPMLQNDSTDPWQDDSVEIYFDMNHNRSTTYQADDFQFVIGYDDPVVFEINGRTTGVNFASAAITGGYSMEISIPWTTLGVTPSIGALYGFDVGINYDQNGGDRDGQMMWNGTETNWTDTGHFGDLSLGPACLTKTITPTITLTN
ncbi:MAG TPA: CBM9 family sugar-binding protein, partial [Candidatus Goldiibacteriota bacterium]|nr:CBM9 family sugar-binding protein [Candidatus Goldiibacteriota bacterium]